MVIVPQERFNKLRNMSNLEKKPKNPPKISNLLIFFVEFLIKSNNLYNQRRKKLMPQSITSISFHCPIIAVNEGKAQ